MDRRECANTAISAAMSCLNMVLEDQDVRDAIVGVPIFTHTLVTFSAVFLLKVAVNWNSAYLSIDGRQVRHTVERIIELMNCVSAGDRHLTRHIARGLSKMLDRFQAAWDGWLNIKSSLSSSSSTSMQLGRGIGTNAADRNGGYDDPTPSSTTHITNNNKASSPTTAATSLLTPMRRSSIPGGANAMAQGLPPPDLIYTMVGTYGFGLDEQLMDPTIPGFEYMS